MTKTIQVSERDRKMLELLALGESSKGIAKKLGYRAGTMRVYLHELYRKLKVPNKTAAVVWYFDNMRAPPPQPAPEAASAGGLSLEEGMGDLALRTDLFTAMGSMSLFVGPYGKLWQVAARLKGTKLDPAGEARSREARRLWEALLRGDFAYAKRRYDEGDALRVDAVPEGLLLATMLATGGYSSAAARTVGELTRARREQPALNAAEQELLVALREASDSGAQEAIAGVHRIASKSNAEPLRHLAIAALHYLHRARGEAEPAKRAAEALWVEAETCQQHLQAMGERPLYPEASLTLSSIAAKAIAGRRKESSAVK
jgi:DNA-binding CsgD family transcriptional regulator